MTSEKYFNKLHIKFVIWIESFKLNRNSIEIKV